MWYVWYVWYDATAPTTDEGQRVGQCPTAFRNCLNVMDDVPPSVSLVDLEVVRLARDDASTTAYELGIPRDCSPDCG